jgi:GTPase SAR1 family protein
MTNFIYLIGPAGCGKSTLTSVLFDALKSYEINSLVVNLDPGAEWLPYTPEIDIRVHVSLSEVMREFKLGPNGALVVAVDLVVNHIPHLKELINASRPDYVIVDTPGQMELFAFRETGPTVMNSLNPGGSSLVLFLIDSFFARRASSFISMLMLATSVLTRFRSPQINVLTKVDTLDPERIERAINWASRRDVLLEDVAQEPNPLSRETAMNLLHAVEKVGFVGELIPVSALDFKGVVELISAIENVFATEGELDLGKDLEGE